jgi:hypothetical protein
VGILPQHHHQVRDRLRKFIRYRCLAAAFNQGFRTSVSAEPLIGGIETAKQVVKETEEKVTDTIWIGKMNKLRLRVDMKTDAISAAVQVIEEAQSDDHVLEMFDALKKHKLIRWKDSIRQVVATNRSSQ